MISSVVYTVFEAMAILFILHGLYDEKIRIEKFGLFFIIIDIIAVVSIDFFGAPQGILIAFYVALVLYSGLRFGFSIKNMAINCSLCLIITSIMQFMCAAILSLLFSKILEFQFGFILINVVLFAVSSLLHNCAIINKISKLFINNNILAAATLLAIIATLVYSQAEIKVIGVAAMIKIIFLIACAMLLLLMAMSLGKSIIANKKLEVQNQLQQLYNESFETLTTEIRMRQHEFENHLNAIKGLKYTCKTYEELIDAQDEYVETLTVDNKYNKILQIDNSILAGFLYNKFKEMELLGIDIKYRVSVKALRAATPVYTMVELIGNLLDNAEEALDKDDEYNRLYIEIVEESENITVEICNENDYISQNELQSFFQKGKSTKGKDRGYGLYHVKKICDENKIDIICENKQISGINYISLCLKIPKGTKKIEKSAVPLGQDYSSS